MIKKVSDKGTFVSELYYDISKEKTKIFKDIDYLSNFPNCKLDITYPKKLREEALLSFGYMEVDLLGGGDKSNITGYGVELAACDYKVVNIN